MSDANQSFGQALVKSLVGERGHIRIAHALPDIDVTLAARTHEAMPYTIYQLVKHMHYWQQFMLEHLEGRKPQPLLTRVRAGLRGKALRTKQPGRQIFRHSWLGLIKR